MQVKVTTEEFDVHNRLIQLGLTLGPIHEAINQGVLVRSRLTANHPRTAPGYYSWSETVAALRDLLRPLGWLKREEGGSELTFNPHEKIAIAVLAGDEGTGVAQRHPSNKRAKGINTIRAIANNNQLELFSERSSEDPYEEIGFATWVLLVHISKNEIRCELSLPSDIGEDGKICAWKERIILPAISRGEPVIEISPPDVPDIDVPVQRKEA